jgi:hypothetical protein
VKIRELAEGVGAEEPRDIQDSIDLMMKLAPDVQDRLADRTGFFGILHTSDGPRTAYFVNWKDGQFVLLYNNLDNDSTVEYYDDENDVIDRLKELDRRFRASRKLS